MLSYQPAPPKTQRAKPCTAPDLQRRAGHSHTGRKWKHGAPTVFQNIKVHRLVNSGEVESPRHLKGSLAAALGL